ncbi:hypothetical protein [Haloglomus litoreum]|uniref:hypothetical protein n=1 Tax=Haloglomus litoreum TaxID=3034026 RepID=UPI0023E8E3BE|nr:hypothetical protein [Haloglomus sp. DT116]
MTAALRTLWEEQPTNPDLEADLGYQLDPLMIIDGPDHGGQVILLPAEEEQLHDDEFIVADAETLVSLADWN